MRNYLSLPILALAVALQVSILPLISLQGGGPNLVFLLVLTWAMHADLRDGVIWAFIGGIMLDLVTALPTGSSVIGLLLVVFAISGLGSQLYRVGVLLLAGLTIAGTVFQQLTLLVILLVLGYRINPVQDFLYFVVPMMVYNLIFVYPIYWLMRRFQRRLGVLAG